MFTPYSVIYADPPWAYTNVRTGGSHTSGSAQKYPVISTFDLCVLPVSKIAAKDAVLFLWATTPMGSDPFEVMRQWGFTYKTKLYWHKRIVTPDSNGREKTGRKGTGYWLRGEMEELLIGIRGKVPAWRSNTDNWLETGHLPTLEQIPEGHSRKPEEVVRLIETLTPGARRIELFATTHSAVLANRHDGVEPKPDPWDCYGLELGHNFLDPTFWESFT